MTSFLTIKVKPSSQTQQVILEQDGSLLVRLKSPPSKGKANKELLRFLKQELGTSVVLVAGQSSSTKRIEVELTPEQLNAILNKFEKSF